MSETQKLDISRENTDSVVYSVIQQFKQRADIGLKKYGKTLDRSDLTIFEWIQHAQEEHMDAILYLEKLKQEYRKQYKHVDDKMNEKYSPAFQNPNEKK